MRNLRNLGYMIFTVVVLIAAGCGGSGDKSDTIKEIQPAAVKQEMAQNKNVIVIDVRTPGEYTGPLGHIPGASLRPLQNIDDWVNEFANENDAEIIMVCRSGNRSGVAAKYFVENGFTNVHNMVGGMKAWNRENLPVEKNPPKEAMNE